MESSSKLFRCSHCSQYTFTAGWNRDILPKDAKRDKMLDESYLPTAPDIVTLFESMTPYFDSSIQLTEELLQLKRMEGYNVLLNTSKTCMLPVLILQTRGK